MATNKLLYTGPTTITCGMDGLTNTSARSCTAIDNTTNLYLDALVQLQLETASGSLGTVPVVYVYAYGLSEGGFYTDGVSGTDGNFTMPTNPNLKLVQIINVNAANTFQYSSPFSIASAFGGILPEKWGIVVVNSTGLSLNGTSGGQLDNVATYFGVQVQSV